MLNLISSNQKLAARLRLAKPAALGLRVAEAPVVRILFALPVMLGAALFAALGWHAAAASRLLRRCGTNCVCVCVYHQFTVLFE